MAVTSTTPAQTQDSRIFIAPNRASCGSTYTYHNCMRMEGVDKSFGDITSVYCPHPTKVGEFLEVAQVQGADGRWTTSLVGRLPLSYESILKLLATKKCAFDVQVHWGKCIDPTDFNTFSMAWVFENVRITGYTLGTLGALSPDEKATIDETVAISAETAYQLFPTYPTQTGQSITADGSIVAMTYGNAIPCDDCLDLCSDWYGLKLPSTALASNDIYIIYSTDQGLTWKEVLLPCSATQSTATIISYNIKSDGVNVYVTLTEIGGAGHLYIVPISSIKSGTISSTLFSVLDNTHDVNATFMYLTSLWTVGNSGFVNVVDKAALTYTVMLDGTLYTSDFYAIHGIDNDNIIIGGKNGMLLFRRNGGSFQSVTFAVNSVAITDNIKSLWMKSQDEWIVGTEVGKLYCTTDSGSTWSLIASFSGCIEEISFATNSAGYLIIKSPAQIWRTFDGGGRWNQITDKFKQIPSTAVLNSLATCVDNPNTFVVSGQIPNVAVANPCDPTAAFVTGTTGVILTGRP